MITKKKKYQGWLNGICFLMTGVSVGWLVGLSVSPVIQTVLASLMAVVVSISSALAGLSLNQTKEDESTQGAVKRKPQIFFDPLPIMFLALGIAMGASLGVYGRTNSWLGPKTNPFAQEWKDTGLDKKEIVLRVFNSRYPATSQPSAPTHSGESYGNADAVPDTASNKTRLSRKPQESNLAEIARLPTLFNVSLEQCKRLRNRGGDDLRREMASSNEPKLNELAKTCSDEKCLKGGVEKVCAEYPR